MDALKIILIAVAIIGLVVLLTVIFVIRDEGVSLFNKNKATVDSIIAEQQERYSYLNGELLSGRDLKITYNDTKDELYWEVTTGAIAAEAAAAHVQPTPMKDTAVGDSIRSATMSANSYINEDGQFLCTIEKRVEDGRLVVTAVQR